MIRREGLAIVLSAAAELESDIRSLHLAAHAQLLVDLNGATVGSLSVLETMLQDAPHVIPDGDWERAIRVGWLVHTAR